MSCEEYKNQFPGEKLFSELYAKKIGLANSIALLGHSPANKLKRKLTNCGYCGKELNVPITRQKIKFCNSKCVSNYQKDAKLFNRDYERRNHIAKSRENSPFCRGEFINTWRDGACTEKYPIEFDKNLKDFVKITHDKCFICDNKKDLVIHHIDHDKSNISLTNLMTLCRSCHGKIHSIKEFDSFWKEKMLEHLTTIIIHEDDEGPKIQQKVISAYPVHHRSCK